MRKKGHPVHGLRLLIWIIMIFLLVGAGCATTKKSSSSAEETGEKKGAATGPVPVYYDFSDILVPAELSLDRKNSFVYSTPAVTTGVLMFEGYVDGASLVHFFTLNMAKDGWILKSSFRFRRTILNFEKGERNCLISVAEYTLQNTKVEIWVAPQLSASIP